MGNPRFGVIGAGWIGLVHLKAAAAAGLEVVAVADVQGQAAEAAAAEFDIPGAFADPRHLIESPRVDAIIVATPNKFHAPLSLAALRAGKDVLVEKPMALNVEECAEMNAAAVEHDRVLQVGLVERFSSAASSARAFIEEGRLGRIYHARATWCRRRGIPGLGGWFTTRSISGGGPLIDLGVHLIDLILHLAGFPRIQRVSGKVYAHFGPRMKDYVYETMWAGPPKLGGTFDVEDAAHAFIRLEGGGTFELSTAWAGNFPDGSMVSQVGLFGDRGGVSIKLGVNELRLAVEEAGHNVDLAPRLPLVDRYEQQILAFAESVRTRTIPIAATGGHGQAVQAILEAIYRSSREDQEVAI